MNSHKKDEIPIHIKKNLINVVMRQTDYDEKFAAKSRVSDANFGKILRMADRWMRAFSASHAPATRRRNLAAS